MDGLVRIGLGYGYYGFWGKIACDELFYIIFYSLIPLLEPLYPCCLTIPEFAWLFGGGFYLIPELLLAFKGLFIDEFLPIIAPL
jgi:hypothetical protein